ncbi:hypothetical protein [Streptomyces lydicus]|uniref:hypothetical protein n=1 Tax=Streptomyces lydicus TaxID=47763 RepID=UPI003790D3F7
MGLKVAKAPQQMRQHASQQRLATPKGEAALQGIDLRTAFVFALVTAVGYIAYQKPAIGSALAVALAFGLFADHFLRRQ